MHRTPEAAVKDAVKKILKKHGVWYFMPVSMGMGQHGIPDFVCCVKGRFFVVECKGSDDLKPTALQEMQMERIRQAGGLTFVVKPGNLDRFEEEVRIICG